MMKTTTDMARLNKDKPPTDKEKHLMQISVQRYILKAYFGYYSKHLFAEELYELFKFLNIPQNGVMYDDGN